MSMTDIATLGFNIDTGPLSAAEAALNRLAKTGADCEAALNRLSANASSAFSRVGAGLQAAAGLGSSATGAAGMATAAAAAGTATTAQHGLAGATTTATGALNAQTAAINRSAHAHTSHAGAAYGNRLQMMELAHVGRALFDEMAAGGNIFRALAMEGGRLQIALSSGEGGVTGLVGRLASGLSTLLNPVAMVTAGIAALGVTAAIAFGTYESGQERLEASLNGLGRRGGATLGRLNSIVQAGAADRGLSNREATGLAAGYTAAGLAPEVSQSLFGAARIYGRITDQSTGEAGSAIAAAMRDPIAGLSQLDKSLGFVDDALKQNVTNLERSGHIQEAQAMLAEALNKALANTTDTTWGFSRAMRDAENWMSNKFGNIGASIAGMFNLDSPQEQLRRAQAQLPYTSNSIFALGQNNTANVQSEIARLQKRISEEDEKAATGRRDALATQRSGLAGDAVRSILPEIMKAQTAANQLEVLRQALSDSTIIEHMRAGGIGDAQVSRAFGNAVVMQSMSRPGVQQQQEYDLRMASADAFSIGEKSIIEARRAELEVLRQTGDVARAATAAQMSMNEAIAKGNSDAEQRLEVSKQNLAMVGMSPFERAMQEVKNRYEGFGGILSKDETTGTDVRKIPEIAGDLGTASHRIQMALDDLPPRIDTAGGKLVGAIEGLVGKVTGAGPAGSAAAGGATLGGFDFGHASGAAIATPAMIADASARTGMPASIIAAIGQRENAMRLTGGTTMLGSNGKPSSAWGFGQLTNGAAADVQAVVPGFSKYNPDTAVLGSAEYLSILAGRRHGNLTAALNDYGGTPGYAADIMRRAGGGIPLNVGVSGAERAAQAPLAPDMLGRDRQAYANDRAAVLKENTTVPIDQANKALVAQTAIIETQRDNFMKSTAAIQGAAQAQKLWNELVQRGVAPAGELSKQTGALADQVRAYGNSAQAVAQRQQDEQERQKSFIGTEDSVRSFSSNSMDSLFTGLAQGKPAGGLLRGIGQNLGQSLIRGGVGMLTQGLFGKSGQAGGGLFGGLLGNLVGLGHYAGGTQDAPGGPAIVGENGPELVRMPPHAQVVSTAALENLRPTGHTVHMGDTNINVQGNADERVLAQMRQETAMAQQQQRDWIVRNLPQIQADGNQTS